MSNLRRAAQQALEALESKYIVNCGAWRVQQDDAITALRAALAEPEQASTSNAATHAHGCWSWGPSHYLCAYQEVGRLREQLGAALDAGEVGQ